MAPPGPDAASTNWTRRWERLKARRRKYPWLYACISISSAFAKSAFLEKRAPPVPATKWTVPRGSRYESGKPRALSTQAPFFHAHSRWYWWLCPYTPRFTPNSSRRGPTSLRSASMTPLSVGSAIPGWHAYAGACGHGPYVLLMSAALWPEKTTHGVTERSTERSSCLSQCHCAEPCAKSISVSIATKRMLPTVKAHHEASGEAAGEGTRYVAGTPHSPPLSVPLKRVATRPPGKPDEG
mmetsp:Transcript_19817/g.64430  ORF Transcript_19817/g.64430 Transcript_19817/m.64430 type:complete len:239 (-) Transcript_19817:1181-1897(-)